MIDFVLEKEQEGLLELKETLGKMLADLHPEFQPENWQNRLSEIQSTHYDVAVVGVMKAGKSTLLNALLFNKWILPTDINECTAAIATITHGVGDNAQIHYMDRDNVRKAINDIDNELRQESGRFETIRKQMEEERNLIEQALQNYDDLTRTTSYPLQQLHAVLAKDEDINGRREPVLRSRLVKEAILETQSSLIKQNVTFVDTPGIQSPVKSRVEITRTKMLNTDCVILLIPHKGIDQSTVDFVKDAIKNCPAGKVFALLGKADLLASENRQADSEELANIIRKQVTDLESRFQSLLNGTHESFKNIRVIPVAPGLALPKPQTPDVDPKYPEGSNLDSLRSYLQKFLNNSKGWEHHRSNIRVLEVLCRQVVHQAMIRCANIESEIQILKETKDLKELQEQSERFVSERREIEAKLQFFSAAYDNKLKNALKKYSDIRVSPDINLIENFCKNAKKKLKEIPFGDRLKGKYSECSRIILDELEFEAKTRVIWSEEKKLNDTINAIHNEAIFEFKELIRDLVNSLRGQYSHVFNRYFDEYPQTVVVESIGHEEIETLVRQHELSRITAIWNLFVNRSDQDKAIDDYKNNVVDSIKNTINDVRKVTIDEHHKIFSILKRNVLDDFNRQIQEVQNRYDRTIFVIKDTQAKQDQRKRELDEQLKINCDIQREFYSVKNCIIDLNSAIPSQTINYDDLERDIATMANAFIQIRQERRRPSYN